MFRHLVVVFCVSISCLSCGSGSLFRGNFGPIGSVTLVCFCCVVGSVSLSFLWFTFASDSFLWGIIGPLGCVAWYCCLRVIAFVFCFFAIAPCRGRMQFHTFTTSCVLGCISRVFVVASLTSVGFGVGA